MDTRCDFCTAKARYFQRHSGTRFCGRCFTRSLRRRVWREIGKNKIIADSRSMVFAVSGGKDSVACLDIVHPLGKARKIQMAVLTIDEGIHGYRPEGIKRARKAARAGGLEFHVASFKQEFGADLDSIIKRLGSPKRACTYCGVLRRWILNKRARQLGADRLITGHNLDDEAESALLNLIRGDPARLARSGPEYLLSHEKLVSRGKPLRGVPGKEALLYDIFNGLDVHLGSCPYAEFDFRNAVRGFLNRVEEDRPTSKSSFLSTVDRLSAQARPLFAGTKLVECSRCGEPTVGTECKACQLLRSVGLL